MFSQFTLVLLGLAAVALSSQLKPLMDKLWCIAGFASFLLLSHWPIVGVGRVSPAEDELILISGFVCLLSLLGLFGRRLRAVFAGLLSAAWAASLIGAGMDSTISGFLAVVIVVCASAVSTGGSQEKLVDEALILVAGFCFLLIILQQVSGASQYINLVSEAGHQVSSVEEVGLVLGLLVAGVGLGGVWERSKRMRHR